MCPKHPQATAMHMHRFPHLQSLFSSSPATPRQHLPSQSKALVVSLIAQKFQWHPTASNVTSGLRFFQKSGFNLLLLFSHSSSIPNPIEWAAPRMLPASTSLFTLLFLLALPDPFLPVFPQVSVPASRDISKSLLLPGLPRWTLRFYSTTF